MKKHSRIAAVLGLVFCAAALPVHGTTSEPPDPLKPLTEHHTPTPDQKRSSLVVDISSGAVLSAHEADKQVHPASLTKVMTLMLLFDELDKGTLKLDDKITISPNAAAASPIKMGFPAGQEITIETAIKALAIRSANDIAIAVAEALGGTESNFAKSMTHKARTLGMADTTFVNASGLPHDQQLTTARDMITLGLSLFNDYQTYYPYFGEKEFQHNGITYRGHNALLGVYDGMDGIKTGYIRASGFNLLTSVQKDGKQIMAVIFGGRSSKDRNIRMAQLLDDALEALDKKQEAGSMLATKTSTKNNMHFTI